jgi:serine/threonine protein kinase
MTQDVLGLVGTTIDGRYDVESVVGEGGFAIVYRAVHLGLGERLAVKCLKVPIHFTAEARASPGHRGWFGSRPEPSTWARTTASQTRNPCTR